MFPNNNLRLITYPYTSITFFGTACNIKSRSSSREVRIRAPFFPVVYDLKGTLPERRALLGDLEIRRTQPTERDKLRHAPASPAARQAYQATAVSTRLETEAPQHKAVSATPGRQKAGYRKQKGQKYQQRTRSPKSFGFLLSFWVNDKRLGSIGPRLAKQFT